MPKGRESGMPDPAVWREFFDPAAILDQLECDRPGDVVEFGCGYGLFTIEAARRSCGVVHALDIEPEMLAATTEAARMAGVTNVRPLQRDFVAEGTGLPDAGCDYAMLFNLLHIEAPLPLLHEAFRVLAPGGRVAIIHWHVDSSTPRGPSLDIRPSAHQCRAWAEAAGFHFVRMERRVGPWHWGLLLQRPVPTAGASRSRGRGVTD